MNASRSAILTMLMVLALGVTCLPSTSSAQGSKVLNLGITANNGNYGVSFEITAIKSTKLYRFWTQASAGATTVEVLYNPGGLILVPGVNTGYNAVGWISLGTANINGAGYGVDIEIPLDLNLLMNPGDKWGFIVKLVSGAGVSYRTGVAPYIYADSYIEVNNQGWAGGWLPLATTSMFWPRQFCGRVVYDEGCFFPDGVISYELLDGNNQPTAFANLPGSVNVRYVVTYPNEASTVNMTLNLRNVITNAIVYSYNFSANKLAGQSLIGVQSVPIPGTLNAGYYKAEVVFNSKNSCGNYADFVAPPQTLLLLPPGATMCIVWPGDTDNNGIVTYADRAALNKYIFDANTRSTWLNGPTRYSVTGGFDYLEWKGQPSAPWNTPDGCYKDTDGNGVINNFDYIAIKLNWLKNNTIVPAKAAGFSAASFAMDQNYPNPFNPSTTIRYAVPERSQVRLVVTDMLGRTVATPVEGLVEQGMHSATFDAANLPSGSYNATVHMSGLESGLSYSRTIKMTLAR
ncbi:MAG TPA: hypothetical protein PK916_13650 [Bacteroidota bacterium]|nr:hypothetical protein [Bacteroidota bacterium]